MPANRFFTPQPLSSPLILKGAELHHLHVMRLHTDDTIEIVNGQGELAHAFVKHIDKSQAHCTITSHQKVPPSLQTLILAQALPRFSSLEWIIEKGTELNVSEFYLFPGDLSEKTTLSPMQLERLHKIAISALKQCGRLYLPQIHVHPKLTLWEKVSGTAFFGDITTSHPITPPFGNRTTFFIGPEKGFSLQETEQLISMGAKGISLSNNILRTETAAITALSQYSYFHLG